MTTLDNLAKNSRVTLWAKSLFLVGVCLAGTHEASAQMAIGSSEPASRRISAANALKLGSDDRVALDGKADEPFWARATPIDTFFEYRPRPAETRFRTEAKIAYDQRAVIVFMRGYDPEPSRIEAPLVRRDEVFGSQDFFGVYLDPVGMRKFAQIFRVNASGSIGDGLFNEDTQNEDFSPDFEWDVAVARHADGWSAEFRIPFSILRYADPPSPNWSVFLVRGVTRDDVLRIGNGRIPRDNNCLMCYAQTVSGMVDLPHGREFTATPNLTLRQTRDREVNRSQQSNARERDTVLSLDVKYRPTTDWVIDATFNPDFSQVELDTPQLAATAQFALFFPEKRPFFLEGADILSSPFNAIYTRSVTDPAWGVRATRRAEGMDMTVITLRDDGKGLILLPNAIGTNIARQDSKSQATIARARWFLGEWSWGLVGTDRRYERTAGKGEMANQVLGLDTTWRPTSALRVRGDVLFSRTVDERNRVNGKTRADDTAALGDFNYRDEQWNFAGGVERVGRDFRADNGFFNQVGYQKAYLEPQRKWREQWGFDEIAPYINIENKTDLAGRLLYRQSNVGISFNRPKLNFGIEARPNQQVRFRANGDALKRDQAFFWLEATPGKWLSSFYLESAIGDRGDVSNNRIGRGYYVGANATIRLFGRWELQPRIDESVIRSRESTVGSNRIVHERAMQLTSVYHFTARDSLRLIVQYSGVRRAPSLYESRVSPFDKTETNSIVYAHKRGLGSTIYIGANASRSLDPAASYSRRINEVFIKASWAFDLSQVGF